MFAEMGVGCAGGSGLVTTQEDIRDRRGHWAQFWGQLVLSSVLAHGRLLNP